MADVSGIALSGAQAQLARLAASASNTANLHSRGALPATDGSTPPGQPEPYRPVEAVTVAAASGARTVFRPVTPAFIPEFDPQASFANDQGVVAAPNIDLAGEATTRLAAGRAYQANLAVIKTNDELLKTLLDAKA
ncbi:MAG: flagellar biosynthesis protein FlgG [Candidatus Hydrogenedens sp.]|nr:flagellar biosynthesis protein FlgG [Candidatus Hydrogenedens sp.]